MKRFQILLALILVLSVIGSVVAMSTAETQIEESWQADIHKLMSEASIPKTTTIVYDRALPEGTEPQRHSYAIEKVNGDGVTMRIDLAMVALEAFSSDDWTALDG